MNKKELKAKLDALPRPIRMLNPIVIIESTGAGTAFLFASSQSPEEAIYMIEYMKGVQEQ